jgi:hypothetical protein
MSAELWTTGDLSLTLEKAGTLCAGLCRRENGVAVPPPGIPRGALYVGEKAESREQRAVNC